MMLSMAGAQFVRADLHVHTLADDRTAAPRPVGEFVDAAVGAGIAVLGITDHNRVDRVRDAIEAADGKDILVLPGVEISSHDGHVLALFSPESLEALDDLVSQTVLKLVTDPRDGSRRSSRSVLDLVTEIDQRGGLAIPAHVDRPGGIVDRLSSTELASLLASPALAGIEMTKPEALASWFSVNDRDGPRLEAWRAREAIPALKRRGLARITSSDAHSPEEVGVDRSQRGLTRLRMDHRNFNAVRNAILFGPRARCKVEAELPPSYPRVLTARFEGGFVDGVTIDFSPNLNCIIGGRGSGKSTILLALRAALGDELGEEGDDANDSRRMPARTIVNFVDAFGTERTAVRVRGATAKEANTDAPITMPLKGLGQDESGRIVRGYETDPAQVLTFLDQFVDYADIDGEERRLIAELADVAAEVKRTSTGLPTLPQLEKRVKELEAQLEAAQRSKLEEVAKWAAALASEGPFLDQLDVAITTRGEKRPNSPIDIDSAAVSVGLDPHGQRPAGFLDGPDGLRELLRELESQLTIATGGWNDAVAAAATPVQAKLSAWRQDHQELQTRLETKRAELEAKGLKVQIGAVSQVTQELERDRKDVVALLQRKQEHLEALKMRKSLVDELHANSDSRYQRRKATLRRVVSTANRTADRLTIHLRYERSGLREPWEQWLGPSFKFRSPRVERVATALTPREMAGHLMNGGKRLSDVSDDDGTPFFDRHLVEECLPQLNRWDTVFSLETMLLQDQVRIEVREDGAARNRHFSDLSTGQQRSVLLSLILCADGDAPLVLDQPEDHLDAPYISGALVGHLEAVKERRQVIIATHSPNLTVLGDAELVIPMYADAGHGTPLDPGAVDRPETTSRVCELLEGGVDAFRRRGERYGFRIEL